jgi:uncharacterized protein YbjT (DUF2867 family)
MVASSGKLVAIAGGSGFIGRAIARRLAAIGGFRVRVLSRNPNRAREKLGSLNVEYARAEVTDPASLGEAIAGTHAVVNSTQFDGYPIENPRRGLTFERIDYGGTVALLKAASDSGVRHFIYISGAAADERSSHPGFHFKAMAERAIRESGIPYTIFRPSLVFGPEDQVVNGLARAIRFAPIFGVPGTGRQKVQPVLVDDLAACVALALTAGEKALARTFEVGGPEAMTFDDLIRMIMDVTGHRRPLVHIPEGLMRMAGAIAEKLPTPLFSKDAVTFVTADNATDIKPLVETLGIQLTPTREALSYLARKR